MVSYCNHLQQIACEFSIASRKYSAYAYSENNLPQESTVKTLVLTTYVRQLRYFLYSHPNLPMEIGP